MHLALNGWFWGQLNTGSGQYLHYLAEYLPQVAPGHQLTLILPRALTSARRQPIITPWDVHLAATPFDGLSRNLAKVWFEQVTFPMACRQLKVSMAHVPYWGSPWWRPCRTVVTVHDLIPLLLPAYWGGPLQQLYTRLVSLTARRVHLVITDSHASRSDIVQHLGIPPARVHAIPLAADSRYRPVTDAGELARVRQAYALPEHFILYLGGFDVRKNVPLLVQAYGRFLRQSDYPSDSPHLVIAGRLPATDSPFAPDPRPLVAREGLSQWVHFTSWVEEADKPALYSLASLFAFPSAYEGFGLPVAEAVSCGTPVVTSRCSSLPEVAPGALLVDPGDVVGLAAALRQAIGMKPLPAPGPPRTWAAVVQETASLLFA